MIFLPGPARFQQSSLFIRFMNIREASDALSSGVKPGGDARAVVHYFYLALAIGI
jgi:hypothetical protein